MVSLVKLFSMLSIVLVSVSVYADSMYQCPLMMRCKDKNTCNAPTGFGVWRVGLPLTLGSKNTGTFFFYGSIYTHFRDATTVTCLYGGPNGPKLYLDNASQYEPFMTGSQWGFVHHGRQKCIAVHPARCSYTTRDTSIF